MHDVADARIELTAPAASQEANNEHPLPGRAWLWRSSLIAGRVGLIVGIGVMLIAWALLQPSLRFQSRPSLRKFLIPLPAFEGRSNYSNPQISPDGRHLIDVAHRAEGANAVVVISLADDTRRNLPDFDFLGSAVYSETGHVLLTYDIGAVKIMAVPLFRGHPRISG